MVCHRDGELELLFANASWKIDISGLGEGLRASKSLTGGSTVNDIGWHLVDNGMGTVRKIFRNFISLAFATRTLQNYDCEDSAHVVIEFHWLNNLRVQQSVGAPARWYLHKD